MSQYSLKDRPLNYRTQLIKIKDTLNSNHAQILRLHYQPLTLLFRMLWSGLCSILDGL